MSAVLATIRYLRSTGMSEAEILMAVEVMEAAMQDDRNLFKSAYEVVSNQRKGTGAERTKRWRDRHQASQEASLEVSQTPSQSVTEPPSKVPPITPLNTPPSEPKGSGAFAPLSATVIHLDARTKLFNEGKLALEAMGVKPPRCGALIGKWLRDTNDDAEAVLAVIQRAEAERVVEPIPWITAALGHLKAQRNARPNGPIQQALDAALAQVRG